MKLYEWSFWINYTFGLLLCAAFLSNLLFPPTVSFIFFLFFLVGNSDKADKLSLFLSFLKIDNVYKDLDLSA